MITGFNYKKNSFLFEDFNNVVSNLIYDDSCEFDMVLLDGRVTDLDKLERKITINHELNHYLQDLSVNACITEGYFLDYISAYTRELTNNSLLRFPLMNQENREYNEAIVDSLEEKERVWLITLYKIYDVYKYIYRTAHIKPNHIDYDLGGNLNETFAQYGISVKFILESYAFHKAYLDCILQDAEGDDCTVDLLSRIIQKDKVYPLQYKDGSIFAENFKRDVFYKAQYQYLDLLLVLSCLPVPVKDYLDYCEKAMPRNYRDSVAITAHSAQKVIIETALNIPSFYFIMSSIDEKKYDIETFSPVHRVYKIIKTIRDYKGYPESKNGEDYFITFFDWCAKINHWPSYYESMNSVFAALSERTEKDGECITNYQLNAIAYKNKKYGNFSQTVPIELLSSLCVPVIVSNKQGLQIQQMVGNIRYDPSGLLDFYKVWFNMPVCKYTQISENMTEQEIFETLSRNHQGAIREMLDRMFSVAVTKALTEDGCFKCPLAENGCSRRTEECSEFTNFTQVLKNCKNYIFRLGCIKIFQGDIGEGNFPDCMLLNYLKDNNINLKNLQLL